VVVETLTWAAQSETVFTERSCDPAGPAADTLFLTSQEGCDSLVIRLYQYTDLQAEVEVVAETCPGFGDGRILAVAVSGGQPPFRFRLNGGDWQAQPVFEGLVPGTYTLTLEDAEGCIRDFPALVIGAGQPLTVDIGPDREVEPGALITLNAQSGQVLNQWQWSAIDPMSCATCPLTELGPITQAQIVTISVLSADGCPAADDLRITLRQAEAELPAVYIPNSFSPNADGINDLFSVFGNAQVLEIRRLAVYDRWGNALYEETGIPPNTPSRGWDGSFRGRPMDPGVFVYVAEVVFQGGRTRIYKGDVTLVR
jgi:gliding motility-associated-like protein